MRNRKGKERGSRLRPVYHGDIGCVVVQYIHNLFSVSSFAFSKSAVIDLSKARLRPVSLEHLSYELV